MARKLTDPKPQPEREPDGHKIKAIALLPDRLGRHVVELEIPAEWIEELAVGEPRGPHEMSIVQALIAQWAEKQGQE